MRARRIEFHFHAADEPRGARLARSRPRHKKLVEIVALLFTCSSPACRLPAVVTLIRFAIERVQFVARSTNALARINA